MPYFAATRRTVSFAWGTVPGYSGFHPGSATYRCEPEAVPLAGFPESRAGVLTLQTAYLAATSWVRTMSSAARNFVRGASD